MQVTSAGGFARRLGRPDLTKITTAADIDAVLETDMVPDGVEVYMGRTEVAYYLGLKSIWSLTGVELPPHDAQIGDRKGWRTETIDAWKASRPGRGRWGARGSGVG